MSTAPQRYPRVSEAEYLKSEKSSPVKHEYVDGEVFERASSSKRHVDIATNILVEFALGARENQLSSKGKRPVAAHSDW